MAFNRYEQWQNSQFQLPEVDLNILGNVLKAKQERYDQAYLLAEDLKNKYIDALPQDNPEARAMETEWQNKISNLVKEYDGDYSAVYRKMQGIGSEIDRQFKPGGKAAAIITNKAIFSEAYKREKERLAKGEIVSSQLQNWYNYYMNPKSSAYYKGVGDLDPITQSYNNLNPEGISEYVDHYKLGLEAVKALHPNATEITQDSVSGYWLVKEGESIKELSPQTIQNAVYGRLSTDPKLLSFLNQNLRFQGITPNSGVLDLAIKGLSSQFAPYAYSETTRTRELKPNTVGLELMKEGGRNRRHGEMMQPREVPMMPIRTDTKLKKPTQLGATSFGFGQKLKNFITQGLMRRPGLTYSSSDTMSYANNEASIKGLLEDLNTNGGQKLVDQGYDVPVLKGVVSYLLANRGGKLDYGEVKDMYNNLSLSVARDEVSDLRFQDYETMEAHTNAVLESGLWKNMPLYIRDKQTGSVRLAKSGEIADFEKTLAKTPLGKKKLGDSSDVSPAMITGVTRPNGYNTDEAGFVGGYIIPRSGGKDYILKHDYVSETLDPLNELKSAMVKGSSRGVRFPGAPVYSVKDLKDGKYKPKVFDGVYRTVQEYQVSSSLDGDKFLIPNLRLQEYDENRNQWLDLEPQTFNGDSNPVKNWLDILQSQYESEVFKRAFATGQTSKGLEFGSFKNIPPTMSNYQRIQNSTYEEDN